MSVPLLQYAKNFQVAGVRYAGLPAARHVVTVWVREPSVGDVAPDPEAALWVAQSGPLGPRAPRLLSLVDAATASKPSNDEVHAPCAHQSAGALEGREDPTVLNQQTVSKGKSGDYRCNRQGMSRIRDTARPSHRIHLSL
jgi:hypothetical protein